jgi:hypothetical protein
MKTCKFGYEDGDETCLTYFRVDVIEPVECFYEYLGDCVGCSMYECMPWETTTEGMAKNE